MSAATYCRICACRTEKPHRFRSFALQSAASDALLAMIHYVNAGVNRGDGLPQNVCSQCLRRLRNTCDFICKVRHAQDVLTSMFPKNADLDPINVPQGPILNTNIKEEPREPAVFMTKEQISSVQMADYSSIDYTNDATERNVKNVSHGSNDTAGRQYEKLIIKPDYDAPDAKKIKMEVPVQYCTSDGKSDINSESVIENESLLEYEEIKIECSDVPQLISNSYSEMFTHEPIVQIKTNISRDTRISDASSECSSSHNDGTFTVPIYNGLPSILLNLPTKSGDSSLPIWRDYFICKRCKKKPKTIKELLDHSMQEHTSCMPFKCFKCSVVILSRKHFFQHMVKHDKNLKQCCEYCGERFVSISDAKLHKETKHVVLKKSFQCRLCDTGFDTNGELKCHQDTFIRGSKGPYTCDHCKRVFTIKSTLKKHMERHYPSEHMCRICNNSFKSKYILEMHHNVHYPTVHYICQVCGKGFKHKSPYTRHLTIHSDAKPHECDICQKKFKLLGQVRRHKQCHGPPLFKCELCSKEFRYQNCLKIHLRMHSNEKPYACEMCNKKFANWSNFNKHMKRIHDHNMAKTKPKNIASP